MCANLYKNGFNFLGSFSVDFLNLGIGIFHYFCVLIFLPVCLVHVISVCNMVRAFCLH